MVSSLWCPRAGLGLVYLLPVFQAGPAGWKNGPTPFFLCRLDIPTDFLSRPISALGPWHALKRNIKKMMGEWVQLGVEQAVQRVESKLLQSAGPWDQTPYHANLKVYVYVLFCTTKRYFCLQHFKSTPGIVAVQQHNFSFHSLESILIEFFRLIHEECFLFNPWESFLSNPCETFSSITGIFCSIIQKLC